MAAVLACGTGALLSHEGALVLWGFAKNWPDRFDVTITQGDRRPKGIRVHIARTLTRADRKRHLGIPVTSAARTLLDCAPHLDDHRRIRTVNDALHTVWLTESALADVIARFPTHPGGKLLKPILATIEEGGLTRSLFEDGFRRFCGRFGLPAPTFKLMIAGHETDAVFLSERLIVECDSWEFHRLRSSFENDRDRDANTLAAGFATVRLTWARLEDQPEREAQRLRQILAQRRTAR
jgi:hypothetical protein